MLSESPHSRRYSDMEELEKHHRDKIVNGVNISGRYRFSIEGRGSHHTLIEIPDDNPYGYDNLVIGTLGASKTAYFINEGNIVDTFSFRRAKLLKFDDIILLDKTLFHIPTGKRTRINERRTSVVKSVESAGTVLDIRGKDKQIEWTGGQFVKYENINAEDVSDEDDEPILSQDQYVDKEISESMDDEKKSYRELLNDVVRDVPYINNRQEAEKYLNGEFEITKSERKAREFTDIKRRYVRNIISINEFEDRVADFFNKNEEYIHTAFENSDNQISNLDTDVEVSDENEEEDDNTLLNW